MQHKTELQKAWSKAVNNKDNYPTKGIYGNKVEGKINIIHYLIYNAVRGLPLNRGFTNLSKPEHRYALDRVNFYIKYSTPTKISSCGSHKMYKERLHLEAYNITIEKLKEKWDEALRLHSSS